MKPLLHKGMHYASLAVGARVRPPNRFVSYTRQLAQESNDDRVVYREILPAHCRNLPMPMGPGSPALMLPETSGSAKDSAFDQVPAAYIARMRGAATIAHGIISPDGRLIGDLSTEGAVRADNVRNHSLLKRISVARYKYLAGRSLAVINAYTPNYYHWIAEVVPRLELLRRHGGRWHARAA